MGLHRGVRACLGVLLAAALLAACTSDPEPATEPDTSPSEGTESEAAAADGSEENDAEDPAATDEPEPCRHDQLENDEVVWLTDAGVGELAQELTARTHRCAEQLVLAPRGEPWLVAIAAAAAVHLDVPLFLVAAITRDDLGAGADEGRGAEDGGSERLENAEDGADADDEDGDETGAHDAGGIDAGAGDAGGNDAGADGAGADEVEAASAAAGGASAEATDAEELDVAWTTAVDELGVEEVLAIGLTDEDVTDTPGASFHHIEEQEPAEAARAVAQHLGITTLLAVPEDDHRARTAALARMSPEVALLPLPTDNGPLHEATNGLPPTTRLRVLASDEDRAQELTDDLLTVGLDAVVASAPLFRSGATVTWLTDPDDAEVLALTAVAARGRGDAVLPIDGQDLRRGREDTERLHRAAADRLVVTGEVTGDADWQLATVTRGEPLPGGGFSLFEDRRMVALYGSPETSVLGAMGEQSLDETIPRLLEVSEPYGADGVEVLPAFEMIVTIASANAEDTGDYSRRTEMELIRPWVERAAEEDLYVILDLQPGRTDFLTQAKEFEELLLEPHVGLALDPEWRLEPGQVHLQQIGSVDAAEVQEVADWLAELTREHHLPEKLLILHQFQLRMLPDRDQIEAPPELAVVIHMDGQGSQGAKDETYAAITASAEDRWLWGWKNFYDEDEPVATPERVLELDPLPVFVSYQ